MGKRATGSNDAVDIGQVIETRRSQTRKQSGLGAVQTLRTKIPIERPAGRPSAVEGFIVNELIRNAAVMKGWLIVNNRIATGAAVNSIRIKIVRDKLGGKFVSENINIRQANFANLSRAADLFSGSNVGLVRGQILAVPHMKFALQGRGSGTPPSRQDILNWMLAKGIGFEDTRHSLSQQAFFIAQKIGDVGTDPPHFSENIRTDLTRVSGQKVAQNIARLWPKYLGQQYVGTWVALGKLWDNIEVKTPNQTQLEFDRFI